MRRGVDKARRRLAVGNVAHRCLQFGVAARELGERLTIDVAGVNRRPLARKGPGHFAADARRAGGDDDAQAFDAEVHDYCSPSRQRARHARYFPSPQWGEG